jgi:hypothetical protein
MPGTRTAPQYDGIPTSVLYTLYLIDASGDLYTDALRFATPPTTAELEAHAVAYQAATNLSLYGIVKQDEYFGEADPDNALALFRASAKEGINFLFKDATALVSVSPRLVGPIADVMQGNQDIPLLSAQEAVDLIQSYLTLLQTYALDSAQFTGRRERTNNPRIKV